MSRRRHQRFRDKQAPRAAGVSKQDEKATEAPGWPGERSRSLGIIGVVLIAICTALSTPKQSGYPQSIMKTLTTWCEIPT